MNWTEILIAFGTGGLAQALLNYFVAKNNTKRDDFEKIVETWEQDNDRLRKENAELHAEIKDLQNQLNTLKIRVSQLERN